jgi:hypothetical protein
MRYTTHLTLVVPHVFPKRIRVHIALVAVQAGEGFVRRVNLSMAHQGAFVNKRFSANITPAKKLKKLASTHNL